MYRLQELQLCKDAFPILAYGIGLMVIPPRETKILQAHTSFLDPMALQIQDCANDASQ
jgi:hypothetical protein